jgi:hypothetical protein
MGHDRRRPAAASLLVWLAASEVVQMGQDVAPEP